MKPLKLAIGSDHAGFETKERIIQMLAEAGYTFNDVGTNSADSVDYPDFAHPVADMVEKEEVDLGILVCGSGNGVAITANKHKGIRAALAWTPDLAGLARQHNDANVLAIPARFISEEEALELVKVFLATEFEGGRHKRRVDKISSC